MRTPHRLRPWHRIGVPEGPTVRFLRWMCCPGWYSAQASSAPFPQARRVSQQQAPHRANDTRRHRIRQPWQRGWLGEADDPQRENRDWQRISYLPLQVETANDVSNLALVQQPPVTAAGQDREP